MLRLPQRDAEIVFYTLFWRQQEIAIEPWEKGVGTNNVRKYPYDSWSFHSGSQSIIRAICTPFCGKPLCM